MFKKRSLRWLVIAQVLLLAFLLLSLSPRPAAQAVFGDRITVSGSQFMAGGQRIWINGANTPWNNWNDFGGNYNASWWDSHFQQLHDNGVNATRVWITCSGEVGINISDAGFVSGATAKHWQDLDSFFQIAQQRQIYVMATLISFDHFKNTYSTYTRWRNMLNSNTNIDSYVTNYVIPFVNRYESNPYLWSIDLINEPDWVHENAEVGQFAWDPLQQYWARAARAIHENSPVLVTVGMGMPKYQSGSCSGCEGNVIADSALRAKVNDPEVYIDFYSSHYYPWQDPYFGGIPFNQSPTSYYGSNPGKPSMIGETPGTGSTGHTLTEDYENAYLNGWQGVMPWTSNGVDGNGGFAQLVPATNAFRTNHPNLVFPSGGQATTPPPTTPPPTTPPPTTPPPTTPPPTTPPPTTPPPTTPPPTTPAGQAPYGGTAWAIPGTIQAENYDTGGEGVAYHDTTAGNSGNAYRTTERVDVQSTTDSGGGYNVGWTAAGEWLEYTVNVTAGGTYSLNARVASQSGGGTLHVEVDGVNVTGALAIPSTGGWQTWTTVTRTGISLSAGQHVLRIAEDSAGFNVNWVSLTGGGTPPVTTPPPTTPPATTPPPTTPPATTPPPTTPPATTPPPTTPPPTTPPPTTGPGACSPVTSTITVPFTFDGAGTFCWQTSRLGSYINSWNLDSLTINGVDFTNRWANSYPPAINGSWYISYRGSFSWSHFEAR